MPDLRSRWSAERPHDRWSKPSDRPGEPRRPFGPRFRRWGFVAGLGIGVVIAPILAPATVWVSLWAAAEGLRSFEIPSRSMEPTLPQGIIALGEPFVLDERPDGPAVGSVIVFRGAGSRLHVKRIVAGPGDSVWSDGDGGVTVAADGEGAAVRSHCTEGDARTAPVAQWTLGPGEFFVLGENCALSNDSRDADFGLVPVDAIEAVIVYRAFTWHEIEPVEVDPDLPL